jgi:hypothetical protein
MTGCQVKNDGGKGLDGLGGRASSSADGRWGRWEADIQALDERAGGREVFFEFS